MAGFEQLRVWQEARRLAGDVYRSTDNFPSNEQYGITSQIRRAAVSVMSNIAEGHGRHSRQEFVRFLYLSKGSLMEVRSLITLSRDLGFLADVQYLKLLDICNTVGVMLSGLIDATKQQIKPQRRSSSSTKC